MSEASPVLSSLSPWGRTLLYAAAGFVALDIMMDWSRRQRGLLSPFARALPASPLANDMLFANRR